MRLLSPWSVHAAGIAVAGFVCEILTHCAGHPDPGWAGGCRGVEKARSTGLIRLQATHDLIGGGDVGRTLLACVAMNNCFALGSRPMAMVLGHPNSTLSGPTNPEGAGAQEAWGSLQLPGSSPNREGSRADEAKAFRPIRGPQR